MADDTDDQPLYVVATLMQITKKRYMDMSKTKHVIARKPIGFIYEDNFMRRIFITEDNQYFEGDYDPSYTAQMFMDRKTTGIYTITKIVFEEMEKADAA